MKAKTERKKFTLPVCIHLLRRWEVVRRDGKINRWIAHCETYSEALKVANAQKKIEDHPVLIVRGYQQGARSGEIKKVVE